MKDLLSASRFLTRRGHEQSSGVPQVKTSPPSPPLRLSVTIPSGRISQVAFTPPSPVPSTSLGLGIATVSLPPGVFTYKDWLSRSEPVSASSPVVPRHELQSPSTTSLPSSLSPARSPIDCAKPLPPSPLGISEPAELPGSTPTDVEPAVRSLAAPDGVVEWDTGTLSAPQLRRSSSVRGSHRYQKSQDSVSSQSTLDSSRSSNNGDDIEISPITITSTAQSPSSPQVSVDWELEETFGGGTTEMVEVTTEAKRICWVLNRRVQVLETTLKDRDDAIQALHEQLQQLKCSSESELQSLRNQSPRIHDGHVPPECEQQPAHDAFQSRGKNEAEQEAQALEKSLLALRQGMHTLGQCLKEKDQTILSLEDEIVCWRDEVASLEVSIERYIEAQRNAEEELAVAHGMHRAFAGVERQLRASFVPQDMSNFPNPMDLRGSRSPAFHTDDGSSSESYQSPLIGSAADDSARIEQLEARIRSQQKDIKLYKLDVKGYKKDLRERDGKIRELQATVLNLQARLADKEGEVLVSDVPLKFDLGSDQPPVVVHPPPTYPPPKTPDPKPSPSLMPPPPPAAAAAVAAAQHKYPPRSTARLTPPRFDPIIEEVGPLDSPTLGAFPAVPTGPTPSTAGPAGAAAAAATTVPGSGSGSNGQVRGAGPLGRRASGVKKAPELLGRVGTRAGGGGGCRTEKRGRSRTRREVDSDDHPAAKGLSDPFM